MHFNISPQDLQSMISRLNAYAGQVGNVSVSVRSYSHQLGGSWNDPQYHVYVQQVDAVGRQLKAAEDQLRSLEHALKQLKQSLEHTHAQHHANMRSR